MKSKFYFVCSFLFLIMFSCSYTPKPGAPNIDPEVVLRNFSTWWNYNYQNIKLYENYTALDTSSRIISKESFLKLLSTGEYVAFRLKTIDLSLKYELYKLGPAVDKFIKAEVKQFGKDAYQNYKMEGTEIPDFNFIDLNGNIYNKVTTKGKIVVLKCWFIHCTTCVAEMPALNNVVKQYQNRKDVLFISLAFDTKEELKIFLTKTKFDYAVIPVQQKYMEEKLNVTGYPTQFIINKKGTISNVVTDYHDMIASLKNEISK